MVSGLRSRSGAACVVLASLFIASAARASCDEILPSKAAASTIRAVTPLDLATLRDIGGPDGSVFGPTPLALSPDGRSLAFVITRGDPSTNIVCRALVSLDLADRAAPRILDRGGDLVSVVFDGRGYKIDNGFPAVITPVWSPDGRWIAYLRRDHGVTQAWRARADGSEASAVTRSVTDVRTLMWTPDGKIIFTSRPAETAYANAVDREALSGWLYDERVIPNVSARPAVAVLPTETFVVDPRSGVVSPANDTQRALLASAPDGDPSVAISPRGQRAALEHENSNPLSQRAIQVTDAQGHRTNCSAASCRGAFAGLWWDETSGALIILRREGWANGEEALYRWTPGSGEPKRILHTVDDIQNCLMSKAQLICTQENATKPRRIVSIDTATGRIRPLFDPNPEFARLRLGTVERLTWRNNVGLPAWGDLVLPPDYHPSQGKLPMIVVQYHSDGFLRGGTGDEYPIFAFAARGYAVLSIEKPADYATAVKSARSLEDLYTIDTQNWAERRSVESSLETGVRMVIAKGIADPDKIGITGLSEGATSARFALVNSRLFAAAAISTCCIDYRAVMSSGGIGLADFSHKRGLPLNIQDDRAFWMPMSLELNVAHIRTPLLMQL